MQNPNWDPATDPNRKPLPDKIEVNLNVNADDIDNRCCRRPRPDRPGGHRCAGRPLAPDPVEPVAQGQHRRRAQRLLWFTSINPKVKPLDNIHCRKAVEYAADKVAYQTAYGGPVAGGDIATTVMPPAVTGYKKFDLYEATTKPHGDVAKAKQELKACGQPNGFSTTMAYRSDRPKEKATATAEQQALSRVGIKLTLQGYPSGEYFTNFAGMPNFVHSNNLGLDIGGWAADWPDGFGFLSQITDGPAIRPRGTPTSRN